MYILREMPDPARLAPVPRNAETRRAFYARWGHENCIVFATCRFAELPPFTQRLSIKLARGGRETYLLGNRSVAVDDDNFLILNDGSTYGSVLDCDRGIESFSVFFRPGLAEVALGALGAPAGCFLDRPDWRAVEPVEFLDALQPHDQVVSPVLRYIRHHLRLGLNEEGWYEEQMHLLLERMLIHDRKVREQVSQVAGLKRSTRTEIYRRIALATDYIHTHYERPLSLDSLARVACLSTFHFLRLFTAVHSLTPHAYLQRKRAQVASRLLTGTPLTLGQIAAEVGYSARSTLFRQVRRWTGVSPRALRNERSCA